MNPRFPVASLLLATLFLTPSKAQDEKKEEPKKSPVAAPRDKEVSSGTPAPKRFAKAALPGEVEIHFLNGSNVRMVVRSEKLEIATLYGTLSVPIRDIRSIDFGLHLPEEYAAKIDLAVKKLASANYRERENAGKTLIELGPFSYPAVREASRDKDMETSRRATDIVKKLQALHPKKDLKVSTDDKVVTPAFTIVGRILTPAIKVHEEYFGEAVLSLAKMRTLRALGGTPREIDVAVDASKYGNVGQWLRTDFQAVHGTELVITASGLVDLMPQQGGGGQVVGPAGLLGLRAGRMKGGGFGGGPGVFAGGAVIAARHGGTLFGKIGEDGDIFIIGDRCERTPERDGKLFLHIGPSPYNGQSEGSYQVKISRKN
jgi:hypothetical protein